MWMDISRIRLKHLCLIRNGRYNFGMTVTDVCYIVSGVEVFNSSFIDEESAESATEVERSGIGVRYGDGFAHELIAQAFDLVRTP